MNSGPLPVSVLLCESISTSSLQISCFSRTGDPHNDPNAQGDAFKTLFVARVVSPQLPNPEPPKSQAPSAAVGVAVDRRLCLRNVLRAAPG